MGLDSIPRVLFFFIKELVFYSKLLLIYDNGVKGSNSQYSPSKGFTLLMIVKQLNLLTSTVVCQRGSQ